MPRVLLRLYVDMNLHGYTSGVSTPCSRVRACSHVVKRASAIHVSHAVGAKRQKTAQLSEFCAARHMKIEEELLGLARAARLDQCTWPCRTCRTATSELSTASATGDRRLTIFLGSYPINKCGLCSWRVSLVNVSYQLEEVARGRRVRLEPCGGHAPDVASHFRQPE